MSNHQGRCLCGEIQFTVGKVRKKHSACHCRMCRRWSSGPFFAAAVQDVAFAGIEPVRFTSSEWADRGFCPKCGTNLFFHFKKADVYMMAVGAFDDPSGFELAIEVFVDSQPAGYSFIEGPSRLTEAEVIAKFTEA